MPHFGNENKYLYFFSIHHHWLKGLTSPLCPHQTHTEDTPDPTFTISPRSYARYGGRKMFFTLVKLFHSINSFQC